MEAFISHGFLKAVPALLALGLSACSPSEPQNRFTRTGELVALSGGEAGARGACHVCHGMKGEGDGNLVPRIAGLDQGYLVRQLDYFADGERQHAQMSWIARRLDNDDRLRVADYYARMELPLKARSGAASVKRLPVARRIYQHGDPQRRLAACATCHGTRGEGVGTGNPAIDRQPAHYISAQLRQWRTGKRYGDPLGAMHEVAMKLSEPEITALGDYVSRLGQEVHSPELREECPPPHRPDPRNGA